jgi:phosphatidate cytidylyltransferase
MMLVLFLTLVASMAWYLFGAGKGRPVANMAITLFGVFYIAALGSFGALILRAGPWANQAPGADLVVQGVAYFIVIALGTTMYDAVGYLAGSRIGKTPLSAASPNKTLEGLAAGMAASFLTVVIFGGFLHIGLQSVVQAALLGLVIALVAPVGDLFESLVKRDLGVKDMGSVLPSHGGLLDRLDAYLFTLPAAYYTLRVLGLVA